MTSGQREEPAPTPERIEGWRKRLADAGTPAVIGLDVAEFGALLDLLAYPGCGCDNDPIECNHEAALGEAEAALATVRGLLVGAACDGCALAEEIGEVVDVPSPVQRRINQGGTN